MEHEDFFAKLLHAVLGVGEHPGPVIQNLEAKAKKHPELDWRHSVVDLMKLVGEDSSLTARIKLAKELGYSGEFDGSEAMNDFLRKHIMDRLAEHDVYL